jgi:hypothetical protein
MNGLGLKFGALGVITVLVIGVIIAGMYISTSNREIDLRNLIAQQESVREANFDKMWKVISQKAQIPGQYKNDFKEVYTPLIEGRYSGDKGGMFMKWIQEHNPKFEGAALYKDLMTSIESLRESFFQEQKKLVSIKKQHDDLLMKFPSSIFVGSRGRIDVKVVSSTKTKEIVGSGIEDDISLFNK